MLKILSLHEHHQAHCGINGNKSLRDFYILTTGPNKDWYWLLIRTHSNMQWSAFRNELLNQYRMHMLNFENILGRGKTTGKRNSLRIFLQHVKASL